MKLLRYGDPGREKPGIIDDSGAIRDLSGIINDLDGTTLVPEELARLRTTDPGSLPHVGGTPRIGPCVARPGKFLCIGLNYADHAKESGATPSPEPIVFGKATSAICGPNDDLVIPIGAKKVDWEVELGIIIGRHAKHVPLENALEHVAGYCVVHDVSERSFQLERHGQWIKGKSCDTFGPLGPWLVTPDEIDDAGNLRLWLEVDGKRHQDGNTRNMIHKVPLLISYLSRFMSLHPGDIISSGTPHGVGMGMTPPTYLSPGQVVTLGVEGLGTQRQHVVAETAQA